VHFGCHKHDIREVRLPAQASMHLLGNKPKKVTWNTCCCNQQVMWATLIKMTYQFNAAPNHIHSVALHAFRGLPLVCPTWLAYGGLILHHNLYLIYQQWGYHYWRVCSIVDHGRVQNVHTKLMHKPKCLSSTRGSYIWNALGLLHCNFLCIGISGF
jgi:hypothetical protein